MRRIFVGIGLVAVAGGLAACSGGGSTVATYKLSPRPVRDRETALPYREVRDGRITFAAIGLRTGMRFITGSHADQEAKGQFVRVRVVCDNGYPNFHTIDLNKQLLVTTDGHSYEPDVNGMMIERQPSTFQLGSHDRIEFDLLFDIPAQAKVKAVRLYGAPTTDLDLPIPNDPGAEAPLS
jgi:hypothetical protein